MELRFLERELKKGEIEYNHITIPYLIAIKEQNPEVWQMFVNLINYVETEKYKEVLASK